MTDFITDRQEAEMTKLNLEINKLMAETKRINQQNAWHGLLSGAAIGGGLVAAGVAIARLFLNGS